MRDHCVTRWRKQCCLYSYRQIGQSDCDSTSTCGKIFNGRGSQRKQFVQKPNHYDINYVMKLNSISVHDFVHKRPIKIPDLQNKSWGKVDIYSSNKDKEGFTWTSTCNTIIVTNLRHFHNSHSFWTINHRNETDNSRYKHKCSLWNEKQNTLATLWPKLINITWPTPT